jgi:hypothetical protein
MLVFPRPDAWLTRHVLPQRGQAWRSPTNTAPAGSSRSQRRRPEGGTRTASWPLFLTLKKRLICREELPRVQILAFGGKPCAVWLDVDVRFAVVEDRLQVRASRIEATRSPASSARPRRMSLRAQGVAFLAQAVAFLNWLKLSALTRP